MRFREIPSHVRHAVLQFGRPDSLFGGTQKERFRHRFRNIVHHTSPSGESFLPVIIFFVQGFCCSCFDSVNAARQPNTTSRTPATDSPPVAGKNVQPRGGQDCSNISPDPGRARSFTYHDSAHCFRYSDTW